MDTTQTPTPQAPGEIATALHPTIVRAHRKKNIFQLQKISRRAARHVRGALFARHKLKAREAVAAEGADIKTVAAVAKHNAALHIEATRQTSRLQAASVRLAAVFAQIMQRRKPEAVN